jgi:hypothetical protein
MSQAIDFFFFFFFVMLFRSTTILSIHMKILVQTDRYRVNDAFSLHL